MPGIQVGQCVIVYLGSPREQIFGMLQEMTASGVVVRGLSIGSVDDWLRELGPDLAGVTSGHGLATTFYPMHRVEKMSLDEPSYGAPPIHVRFHQRTGVAFDAFLQREEEEAAWQWGAHAPGPAGEPEPDSR